jgi:YegS/Rv2252/BmrU family lipid kinase
VPTRPLCIVNPVAAGGRCGKSWPAIRDRLSADLGPVDHELTAAPLEATRLAREAVASRRSLVVAVGGDGTVNEVVNGLLDGRRTQPETRLGLVVLGTGGDLARSLDLPRHPAGQVAVLSRGSPRRIDAGRVRFVDGDGHAAARDFVNIASFGLSGATDAIVNRRPLVRRLGGRVAFLAAVAEALARHRCEPVRVRVDDGLDRVLAITTVAVCNGQYFGGGMRMAPDARLDDGCLDVVAVSGIGAIGLLRRIHLVYAGRHLALPHVTFVRGRSVTAHAERGEARVPIDIDGEAPGFLPASFEVLPGALTLLA